MGFQGVENGSVQDGYFDQPFEGFPGQIATLQDFRLIDPYPVDTAEANGIAVGIGAARGTDISIAADVYGNIEAPYTIINPVDINSEFVGITVRDSGMSNDANGNPVWDAKRMAPVMRRGRIFVPDLQAVTPDDDVWWIVADNGGHGLQIGAFVTADLLNNDTVNISTVAKWWKTAAAGAGRTILELNMP